MNVQPAPEHDQRVDLRTLLSELNNDAWQVCAETFAPTESMAAAIGLAACASINPAVKTLPSRSSNIVSLEDQYGALERAARLEIHELRTRLAEAHQELAEKRAQQFVMSLGRGVESEVHSAVCKQRRLESISFFFHRFCDASLAVSCVIAFNSWRALVSHGFNARAEREFLLLELKLEHEKNLSAKFRHLQRQQPCGLAHRLIAVDAERSQWHAFDVWRAFTLCQRRRQTCDELIQMQATIHRFQHEFRLLELELERERAISRELRDRHTAPLLRLVDHIASIRQERCQWHVFGVWRACTVGQHRRRTREEVMELQAKFHQVQQTLAASCAEQMGDALEARREAAHAHAELRKVRYQILAASMVKRLLNHQSEQCRRQWFFTWHRIVFVPTQQVLDEIKVRQIQYQFIATSNVERLAHGLLNHCCQQSLQFWRQYTRVKRQAKNPLIVSIVQSLGETSLLRCCVQCINAWRILRLLEQKDKSSIALCNLDARLKQCSSLLDTKCNEHVTVCLEAYRNSEQNKEFSNALAAHGQAVRQIIDGLLRLRNLEHDKAIIRTCFVLWISSVDKALVETWYAHGQDQTQRLEFVQRHHALQRQQHRQLAYRVLALGFHGLCDICRESIVIRCFGAWSSITKEKQYFNMLFKLQESEALIERRKRQAVTSMVKFQGERQVARAFQAWVTWRCLMCRCWQLSSYLAGRVQCRHAVFLEWRSATSVGVFARSSQEAFRRACTRAGAKYISHLMILNWRNVVSVCMRARSSQQAEFAQAACRSAAESLVHRVMDRRFKSLQRTNLMRCFGGWSKHILKRQLAARIWQVTLSHHSSVVARRLKRSCLCAWNLQTTVMRGCRARLRRSLLVDRCSRWSSLLQVEIALWRYLLNWHRVTTKRKSCLTGGLPMSRAQRNSTLADAQWVLAEWRRSLHQSSPQLISSGNFCQTEKADLFRGDWMFLQLIRTLSLGIGARVLWSWRSCCLRNQRNRALRRSDWLDARLSKVKQASQRVVLMSVLEVWLDTLSSRSSSTYRAA